MERNRLELVQLGTYRKAEREGHKENAIEGYIPENTIKRQQDRPGYRSRLSEIQSSIRGECMPSKPFNGQANTEGQSMAQVRSRRPENISSHKYQKYEERRERDAGKGQRRHERVSHDQNSVEHHVTFRTTSSRRAQRGIRPPCSAASACIAYTCVICTSAHLISLPLASVIYRLILLQALMLRLHMILPKREGIVQAHRSFAAPVDSANSHYSFLRPFGEAPATTRM